MKRPARLDYLVGHPVMLVGSSLLLAGAIYEWWRGAADWPLPAIMAALASWAFKASDRITAYRDWKREWEGMDPRARRPVPPMLRRVLGALALGLGFYYYSEREDPTHLLLFGLLVAWFLLWVVHLLVRRIRARRARTREAAEKNPIVALCVQDKLLPTPPLSVAYQRLPAHCHAALRPAAKPPTRAE